MGSAAWLEALNMLLCTCACKARLKLMLHVVASTVIEALRLLAQRPVRLQEGTS